MNFHNFIKFQKNDLGLSSSVAFNLMGDFSWEIFSLLPRFSRVERGVLFTV